MVTEAEDPRLLGVNQDSRRDVWVKKLLYPHHSLPTTAAPVLVAAGLAWRDGVLSPVPVLAVFFTAWFVHLGGLVSDNYFNLARHPGDPEHPALVHALDEGIISLGEVRRAMMALYGAALLGGAYLVYLGGVPLLVAVAAAVAASLMYSTEVSPVPVSDFLFFLFFGPVTVAATYYVQVVAGVGGFVVAPPPGSLPLYAVAAGVPVGALTTAVLIVDNVRDLEHDRAKGEPTMATVLGPYWSKVEYGSWVGLAYLVPLWFWWAGYGVEVLLPLLTLPYALLVARNLWDASTYPELLPLSPQTGRLLLAFSVLLAAGLATG